MISPSFFAWARCSTAFSRSAGCTSACPPPPPTWAFMMLSVISVPTSLPTVPCSVSRSPNIIAKRQTPPQKQSKQPPRANVPACHDEFSPPQHIPAVDGIPIDMLVLCARSTRTRGTRPGCRLGSPRSGGILKFSTRARYGMRAMLDLAINGDGRLVLLKDIASRQEISKRYLEHMMTLLRNRGLVIAERGAAGGYRLARPASDITLVEIFEALEGALAPVECVRDRTVCGRAEDCVVRDLWCDVADAMRGVLEDRTLADLKERWEKQQS